MPQKKKPRNNATIVRAHSRRVPVSAKNPDGVSELANLRKTRRIRKLGRPPDVEELILEYKGLLKSETTYKQSALKKFRKAYATLKKK